jgi:hypothetical protein
MSPDAGRFRYGLLATASPLHPASSLGERLVPLQHSQPRQDLSFRCYSDRGSLLGKHAPDEVCNPAALFRRGSGLFLNLISHRSDGGKAVEARDPFDVAMLVDGFSIFIGRQIDP